MTTGKNNVLPGRSYEEDSLTIREWEEVTPPPSEGLGNLNGCSVKKPEGQESRVSLPLAPRPPLRFDKVNFPNGVKGLITETIGATAGAAKAYTAFFKDDPTILKKESSPKNLLTDMRSLMERNIEDNLSCPGITYGTDWSKEWNSLQGKIVLFCSPGPSLGRHIAALKELRHQDDIHILALNRTIMGLTPDSYVCVERRCPDEWTKGRQFDENTTLFATPQTCSRLTARFDKVRWGWTNLGGFGYDEKINWLSFMDGQALSTASTAAWMMHKLQPKAVIMLGCDFAMECKTVSDTSVEMGRAYFNQDYKDCMYFHRDDYKPPYLCYSEDKWTGDRVVTNRALLTFRDSFESMIRVIEDDFEIPFINSSGWGMLDYRNMNLEDAVKAARSL